MVVQHPAYGGNVVCCCMHQVRECTYKPIQMQFCGDDLSAEHAAIVEKLDSWRHTAFPVQKCANFAELVGNEDGKYTWIFDAFGEESGSYLCSESLLSLNLLQNTNLGALTLLEGGRWKHLISSEGRGGECTRQRPLGKAILLLLCADTFANSMLMVLVHIHSKGSHNLSTFNDILAEAGGSEMVNVDLKADSTA